MTQADTLPKPCVDYLEQVAQGLVRLPAASRDELLRELRGHFEDALAGGLTPEVLLASMGAPKALADNLREQQWATADRSLAPTTLAAHVGAAALKTFVASFFAGVLFLVVAAYAVLGLAAVRQESLHMVLMALCVAPSSVGIGGWRLMAGRLSRARLLSGSTFAWMTLVSVGLAALVGCFIVQSHVVFDTPLSGQDARYTAARTEYKQLVATHASEPAVATVQLALAASEREWSTEMLGAIAPSCLAFTGLTFGYMRVLRRNVGWMMLAWMASIYALLASYMIWGILIGEYTEEFIKPAATGVTQGGVLYAVTPILMFLQLVLVVVPLCLVFGNRPTQKAASHDES